MSGIIHEIPVVAKVKGQFYKGSETSNIVTFETVTQTKRQETEQGVDVEIFFGHVTWTGLGTTKLQGCSPRQREMVWTCTE